MVFPFSSKIDASITAAHSGHSDFVDFININPLDSFFMDNALIIFETFLDKSGMHHPPAPPDGRKVRVLAQDGEYIGVGERGIGREVDKVVQFERFGFVRRDDASKYISQKQQ
jgi:glutamyl-tRNA synthetase